MCVAVCVRTCVHARACARVRVCCALQGLAGLGARPDADWLQLVEQEWLQGMDTYRVRPRGMNGGGHLGGGGAEGGGQGRKEGREGRLGAKGEGGCAGGPSCSPVPIPRPLPCNIICICRGACCTCAHSACSPEARVQLRPPTHFWSYSSRPPPLPPAPLVHVVVVVVVVRTPWAHMCAGMCGRYVQHVELFRCLSAMARWGHRLGPDLQAALLKQLTSRLASFPSYRVGLPYRVGWEGWEGKGRVHQGSRVWGR